MYNSAKFFIFPQSKYVYLTYCNSNTYCLVRNYSQKLEIKININKKSSQTR